MRSKQALSNVGNLTKLIYFQKNQKISELCKDLIKICKKRNVPFANSYQLCIYNNNNI